MLENVKIQYGKKPVYVSTKYFKTDVPNRYVFIRLYHSEGAFKSVTALLQGYAVNNGTSTVYEMVGKPLHNVICEGRCTRSMLTVTSKNLFSEKLYSLLDEAKDTFSCDIEHEVKELPTTMEKNVA